MSKFLKRLYARLPIVRELLRLETAVAGMQGRLAAIERNAMVRLLDFDLRDDPRYGDPRRLLRYHAQVCSQNGEDGIIHEIFRRIGTTSRVFVELGVGNGTENNTAFLLSQDWTGYWIDADPRFQKLLAGRDDFAKQPLKYLVAFINRENVGSLFQQLGVPETFDLLSLDVDQNTYYVWEALRAYRPRVVVIEYNAALPADLDWKVRYGADRVWNRTQNFGASLKALELLGRTLGYSLVGCDFMGVNAFFVRDDLVAGQFVEPYTAENHYEPPRYSMVHRRAHRPWILDRPS